MVSIRILITVALALAAVLSAIEASAQAAQRPRIGLVLGGGGARGGAHIGVLEVLEELRIPVDCVAGTSMGALVGGAYAAGIPPAQMREKIGATDWSAIFDDSAGRDEVDLRHKHLDDRFFSALEFGVGPGGLRYREGAVAGQKIKLFFNSLVRSEAGDRNIEELGLPLTLIATDIGTGGRVAMRTGNLTSAMRASMSVPGVMTPIVREGRKLVDGGLVDNVPIQEVRERCGAEAVIAINVGSPLSKPEEVGGLLSVVGQMVNLLTEQNVATSLKLLGPKDVYMRPELGDITAASFDRQLEAAAIGRATALAHAEALRRYSVAPAEYEAWRNRLQAPVRMAEARIDEIQVGETRYVNRSTVREALAQKEGEPLDVAKLDRDLIRIYSGGDLQTIDYSVVNEREKRILRVTPIEKPLGPDYVRFGLNLYSDFRGDARYNVRGLFRRTWLNTLGGEFLAGGQIGSEQRIFAELYQPVEPRQVWFVRAYLNGVYDLVPVYSGGDKVAEYRATNIEASAETGFNLGIYGQARAGWVERKTKAELETGDPILAEGEQRLGGARATLAIDTYDYAFFPTRGYKVDAEAFEAQRVSSGTDKYGTASLRLGGAWSIRDVILVGAAEWGRSTHGTLPLSDLFVLGGPRRLSGFGNGQMRGDDMAYGRFEAQYKLTKPIPLLGLQVIAGVMAETGRMKQLVTEPALSGWQQSYGVYLAANSAFGPIYLGYSDAKNGKGRFYFFIGTP
jgi:NTE family protein